jgi:uncharacterized membrane protein YebE (DUF533 family)
VPATAAPDERLHLLQVMAAVARADGEVDRAERKMLRGCAQRWGVDWSLVQPVLDGDVPPDLTPSNPARAKEILQTLVEVAKADGRIDPRERRVILQAAANLGLSEQDATALF